MKKRTLILSHMSAPVEAHATRLVSTVKISEAILDDLELGRCNILEELVYDFKIVQGPRLKPWPHKPSRISNQLAAGVFRHNRTGATPSTYLVHSEMFYYNQYIDRIDVLLQCGEYD